MSDQAQQRNEAATQAPRPITIGGTTYLVSPPTPADLVAVKGHITKRAPDPLDTVIAKLESIPAKFHATILKTATELHVGGGADITGEGAYKLLVSPRGIAFLAWLLLRKRHPDLKLEDLAPHITDDNCEAVYVQLSEAAGMGFLGN